MHVAEERLENKAKMVIIGTYVHVPNDAEIYCVYF